uniref:malate synthase n=1 Tax=Xenopus tropicalis TaxID=8364 RepID=A0A5S6MRQ2_XENTR
YLINYNLELSGPPSGLESEFNTLLTPGAIHFLKELTSTFNEDVDTILWHRTARKVQLDRTNSSPDFALANSHVRNDPSWKVSPVPRRLQNRHVDIGDTAPCKTERFHRALLSSAQGIQVDFDDGNCPTFFNQIKGIFNIYQVVHNKVSGIPPISKVPVLMLRPRAWNMVEHNMMINGREVPGPLFDYGLLMYHTGRKLYESESGPFFYLSKVESSLEAKLWNDIFVWTENKLNLPVGSIKATVLIESVLASFEMEEILYELKEHSAGLNCGIWDYSASFVNKFGHRQEFLLPDRSKYVNMEKLFLKSYMDLLVQTCHRRGALATGGMAALLLPENRASQEYQNVIEAVTRLKLFEISAGVDGFMVYDIDLVAPMQKVSQLCMGPKILHTHLILLWVSAFLTVTGQSREGHFFYCGKVEDSATAEISRSQVWQWIRHQVRLEEDNRTVTRINEWQGILRKCCQREKQRLHVAAEIFLEIVLKRDFPEFITTYLNLDHTFLGSTI